MKYSIEQSCNISFELSFILVTTIQNFVVSLMEPKTSTPLKSGPKKKRPLRHLKRHATTGIHRLSRFLSEVLS